MFPTAAVTTRYTQPPVMKCTRQLGTNQLYNRTMTLSRRCCCRSVDSSATAGAAATASPSSIAKPRGKNKQTTKVQKHNNEKLRSFCELASIHICLNTECGNSQLASEDKARGLEKNSNPGC